jgi:hypothetical protein
MHCSSRGLRTVKHWSVRGLRTVMHWSVRGLRTVMHCSSRGLRTVMHCSSRGLRTVMHWSVRGLRTVMHCSLRGLRTVRHCSVRGLKTVHALLCERIKNCSCIALWENCEPLSCIAPFPGVQIPWHRYPLLERLHDVTRGVLETQSCVRNSICPTGAQERGSALEFVVGYSYFPKALLFDVVCFMNLKYIYCEVNIRTITTIDSVINSSITTMDKAINSAFD